MALPKTSALNKRIEDNNVMSYEYDVRNVIGSYYTICDGLKKFQK